MREKSDRGKRGQEKDKNRGQREEGSNMNKTLVGSRAISSRSHASTVCSSLLKEEQGETEDKEDMAYTARTSLTRGEQTQTDRGRKGTGNRETGSRSPPLFSWFWNSNFHLH